MVRNKVTKQAAARAMRRDVVGTQFNCAMLVTAREAMRFSQAELAEILRVSQALIGKWEAGISTPNAAQIFALAAALDVRPELLFVDRARRLSSLSDFYHRALAKARRADFKAIHARCSIIDIQIDRLLGIAVIPDDAIPEIDPDEHEGDIERVAAMARSAMGIGPGPIVNLVGEIERCGAIVIDKKLEVDEVDALCRWVPEMPKLFFLNGAKPPDRMRWSLAHELGHTVMHFGRDLDPSIAEDQANRFASAFLMPADDIRGDFRDRVTLTDLAAIKRKWRVSMQAAAKHAHAIRAIDERAYRWLCIQISRKGWRKAEPVAIEGETPTVFNELLALHLTAGYSKADLATLLFISETSLEKMLLDAEAPTFGDHGVRLRVVRGGD